MTMVDVVCVGVDVSTAVAEQKIFCSKQRISLSSVVSIFLFKILFLFGFFFKFKNEKNASTKTAKQPTSRIETIDKLNIELENNNK